ncbi:MAG: sialate O-acetylesterase [Verrucomicrobiota bacterium]
MKNIFPVHALFGLLAVVVFSNASLHAADPVKLPAGVNKDKLHLFLFVGQSNMAGRAKLEEQDKGVIDGVWLFNDQGQWEAAQPPLNRYSKLRKTIPSRLNPALGFVKAYRKKFPDVQIGVICSAQGGSSIEEWEKGREKNPKLYAEAIRATQLAMSAGGELKGICWHQGESNAKRVPLYPAQLKLLVKNFRTDLGKADLPFVFAQIGQWKPEYGEFNKMIVKQDQAIEQTACVKTDDLKNFDNAHFDSASQRILGRRYAEKMFGLLGE